MRNILKYPYHLWLYFLGPLYQVGDSMWLYGRVWSVVEKEFDFKVGTWIYLLQCDSPGVSPVRYSEGVLSYHVESRRKY